MAAEEMLAYMEEYFHVYPEDGIIIWKKRPSNRVAAGSIAGHDKKIYEGCVYREIRANNEMFYRHHLIFLWVNKRWHNIELDHEDGNSLNDKIDNLREATHAQNMRNRRRRTSKSIYPMGVRKYRNKFTARIRFNGKDIHLGSFATVEEASNAYQAKRKELFNDFA